MITTYFSETSTKKLHVTCFYIWRPMATVQLASGFQEDDEWNFGLRKIISIWIGIPLFFLTVCITHISRRNLQDRDSHLELKHSWKEAHFELVSIFRAAAMETLQFLPVAAAPSLAADPIALCYWDDWSLWWRVVWKSRRFVWSVKLCLSLVSPVNKRKKGN